LSGEGQRTTAAGARGTITLVNSAATARALSANS
jgi:hypothetical protein